MPQTRTEQNALPFLLPGHQRGRGLSTRRLINNAYSRPPRHLLATNKRHSFFIPSQAGSGSIRHKRQPTQPA